MQRRALILLSFLSILLNLAPHSGLAVENDLATDGYAEISWLQLIPEDDLDALSNPPEAILDLQDGSADDSVGQFSQQEFEDEASKRYQQALVSTRVVETYKGKLIRLPGFVVPLEYNKLQRVTEFFIVPYFGACLHTPPPPPNQIIYASYEQGIAVENLYDPYWFEGELAIEMHQNVMGTSAYQMVAKQIKPYGD